MTKEKLELVKNGAIKVGLIIGLVVLGLLILASIVGIILSLCNVCDLLAVSASVFVAAISSFLTVLALMLTVKNSNETIELQNRLIELQRETIELQRSEKESKSKSSINLIRNSLCLEKIEINKSLLPKQATHRNSDIADENLNMRIGLIFSGRNINELSGAVLKRFALYFNHRLSNNEQLKFNLCGKFDEFKSVEVKNENTFLYEIITNVPREQYNNIKNTLDTVQNCSLIVDMRFVIMGNNGAVCAWEKRNHNRPHFKLSEFEQKKQIFIFNKCSTTGRV